MNSMVAQVYSLPDIITDNFQELDDTIRNTLSHYLCLSMKRLFLTGCGDSYHAALNAELAFESIAGVPVEPLPAHQFSRYGVAYLPQTGPGTNVVVGISVSGEVARTVEAINLANQAGAETVALTAAPGSRVDETAKTTLFSTITPFPDPQGVHTPGVRSYAANQLALFLMSIHIGEVKGLLSPDDATALRGELRILADAIKKTIENSDKPAQELAMSWSNANEFVFVGSGPNFGTALFSAAKILEASGDPALGQDLEEWAHLQYFARAVPTPTFIINAGMRDLSRAVEVAIAAKTIGRRVVVITPPENDVLSEIGDSILGIAPGVREAFSPLITAIPGELFAAYRADAIAEPFFRDFHGGRSIEEGGGISRIRTSEILEVIPR